MLRFATFARSRCLRSQAPQFSRTDTEMFCQNRSRVCSRICVFSENVQNFQDSQNSFPKSCPRFSKFSQNFLFLTTLMENVLDSSGSFLPEFFQIFPCFSRISSFRFCVLESDSGIVSAPSRFGHNSVKISENLGQIRCFSKFSFPVSVQTACPSACPNPS